MRTLALVLLSLAIAAPASAQFKVPKKVKDVTGAEKAKPAAAPAATGGGGMLVLDDEVIDQMIKGLRARDAHKAAAAKGGHAVRSLPAGQGGLCGSQGEV